MKKFTVELPNGYDDAVTITAIGMSQIEQVGIGHVSANVTIQASELNGHDGETLVIKPHESPEWRKPETDWIPCSERLPENDVPVNIVWTNHNPESYYSHIKDKQFTATGVCHNGKWHLYSCVCLDYLQEYGKCEVDEVDETIEILFWMPLPEPPEEV